MPEHEHDEGYTGTATVVVDDEEVAVEVRLRYRHEPFDGRLRWSGRVCAHQRLTELAGGGADVRVRTGGHSATGRLDDPDLWDRYRLSGVGPPPFAVNEPPPPESD